MKKFEERLERLEELADAIKAPDLPLEEALAVFEEGIKLAKGLEKELERMEGKVEALVNKPGDADADPVLELFDAKEE